MPMWSKNRLERRMTAQEAFDFLRKHATLNVYNNFLDNTVDKKKLPVAVKVIEEFLKAHEEE